MTSEQALNHPAQLIEIDNQVAVFFALNTNGSPTYCVIYYSDVKDGKSNTWADIASNLPFYETADLLRAIHVTFQVARLQIRPPALRLAS